MQKLASIRAEDASGAGYRQQVERRKVKGEGPTDGPTTAQMGRRSKAMRLPIDTNATLFLAAGAPEQVVDFDTKAPKTDEHGTAIYACQLVMLADGGAEIITVKTTGEPLGVTTSTAVAVIGLVATSWTMGDRSGISFRAEKIVPASTAEGKSTHPQSSGGRSA